MPNSSNYIPRPDIDFQDWAHNFYNYALANYASWQISESPQASIATPLANFTTAFAAYQSPNHGKDDVLAKQATREALEHACRQYYSAWISNNPHVSDVDRNELRVTIKSGARTPSTSPTTRPIAEKIETALRQITIHFHDEGSTHKAKPKDAHECEISWGLLAEPPVDEAHFPHSNVDTRTPFTLTFHENQRGQKLYFCLRWIGPTGLPGPWSEIYNAIVP
ncbi:MAG: hypothetical protein LBO00_08250 [Zoogloeaceae bacterium]|jgi:hypothetical protein|nr:hypothetical protein [Zoogloeaceae bacterium]